MKMLLYCTKAKPFLREYPFSIKERFYQLTEDGFNAINGKIVAECDYEVEEIRLVETPEYAGSECNTFLADLSLNFETKTLNEEDLCKQSCINAVELDNYLNLYRKREIYGYAIHIKNLHIFDEPKELSDYYTFNGIANDVNYWKPIDKAPQNMMYAYELISELGLSGTYNMHLRKNIVISIRSQWMCLILNHIKDVEVRRVVLKEMLK